MSGRAGKVEGLGEAGACAVCHKNASDTFFVKTIRGTIPETCQTERHFFVYELHANEPGWNTDDVMLCQT